MLNNFSKEELVNMNAETFRSQLSERKYVDYIQYLIKKHKKHELFELSSYFLELFSEDHDQCRISLGYEIDSLGKDFWNLQAYEVFDLVHDRYSTWDDSCTDSQIIDMFQNISFLYATNCYLHKQFRKTIGVKIGFFS